MKNYEQESKINEDLVRFGGNLFGIILGIPFSFCIIGILIEIIRYIFSNNKINSYIEIFKYWPPLLFVVIPPALLGIIFGRKFGKIAYFSTKKYIITIVINAAVLGILELLFLMISFVWYQSMKIGFTQSIDIVKNNVNDVLSWITALSIIWFAFLIPTAITGWAIRRKAQRMIIPHS